MAKKVKYTVKEKNLLLKDDTGQEYALVTKMLGNRRVECFCFDGETRQCHIRGSMKKRKSNFIRVDDIVLVSLREYDDMKGDILHKYSDEHVRKLKKLGEIPDTMQNDGNEMDDFIVFDDEPSENVINDEVDIDAI